MSGALEVMNRNRLLVILPALLAVGCASDNDVSNNAIIHNLSPELQGSVERPIDINRNMNATADVNARLFWDDMGRAFYTDHPSSLTPLPVTGTSGMPK